MKWVLLVIGSDEVRHVLLELGRGFPAVLASGIAKPLDQVLMATADGTSVQDVLHSSLRLAFKGPGTGGAGVGWRSGNWSVLSW